MNAGIDPIELLHPSPDVAERKLELLHDLSIRRINDAPGAAREALAMVMAGIDHIRVSEGPDGAQHALDLVSAENGRLIAAGRDAAIFHGRRAASDAARESRRTAP